MDIEQLKLILNMLGEAGEGAFTIFVIVIGVGLLKHIVVYGTLGIVAWLASTVIQKAVASHSFGVRIAELFGESDIEYHSSRQRVYDKIISLMKRRK